METSHVKISQLVDWIYFIVIFHQRPEDCIPFCKMEDKGTGVMPAHETLQAREALHSYCCEPWFSQWPGEHSCVWFSLFGVLRL